jgi:competence protein ComEA
VSSAERTPARDPLDGIRTRQLGPSAVRALAVFALAVAVLAAFLAWRARPQVLPVAPVTTAGSETTPAASPAGTVVVAVSGHVRRPGLVRLPEGARVADAVEAAGGALTEGDLALLNLARKVTDGELILVGVTPPPGGPNASDGTGGGEPGLVNLNTATSTQLQTLPGVGPVLADRIIAYRDEHGRFTSVTDLRNVTGIGDARYNELKDRVTV